MSDVIPWLQSRVAPYYGCSLSSAQGKQPEFPMHCLWDKKVISSDLVAAKLGSTMAARFLRGKQPEFPMLAFGTRNVSPVILRPQSWVAPYFGCSLSSAQGKQPEFPMHCLWDKKVISSDLVAAKLGSTMAARFLRGKQPEFPMLAFGTRNVSPVILRPQS